MDDPNPLASPYPEHWEADVVVRDGRPVHMRPIRPDDAERLVRFHAALSPETIYLRFFAPYPELSDRDVRRFTQVDHRDRVALVATVRDEILAVGRFDRLNGADAEVAFTVRDDQQGRGLGSVLLEHLSAAGREVGIERFVAEVLPSNRRMISTFREAGYRPRAEIDDGVLHMEFDIEPTAQSRAVVAAREHRSEARSIERLLHPSVVAVIGAGRDPASIGHRILRNVVDSGFAGRVVAIHPQADTIAGVAAYRSIQEVGERVDLAVVAVPAPAVVDVVSDCAAGRVLGLVVVSRGFSDDGTTEGLERQRELVSAARGAGMRVVGPHALGLTINDETVKLNASLAPMPAPGRLAFFCQSGALGIGILRSITAASLGLRTFVSAGNRADVSGNDLLAYWEDDDGTDVVMLYLESVGNPRKFARVARRVSRRKPIVAIRSGRSTQAYPLGQRVRRTALPPAAVDSLFAQAGIIEVDTVPRMLDVAALLAFSPLPRTDSVAVISNSDSLAILTADALESAGLMVAGHAEVTGYDAPAAVLASRLSAALEDPVVGAVIVVHVPPVDMASDEHEQALRTAAARGTVPVIAVMMARPTGGLLAVTDENGSATKGSVPVFASVEEAVAVLGAARRYARWRDRPDDDLPELPDVQPGRARDLLAARGATPDNSPSRDEATDVLATYGIEVWEQIRVANESEAIAAAARLGYPVVVKTTLPRLRQRTDLGGLRLNLENERALRTAFLSMVANLDQEAAEQLVVQRMAPPGVAVAIRTADDPLFGPIVSFALAGSVSELLGGRAWAVPPLTAFEADELIAGSPGAELLFGYQGSELTDTKALRDLLVRVSRLVDDVPEIAGLALDPVIVSARGVSVLDVSITLAPTDVRADGDIRKLTVI